MWLAIAPAPNAWHLVGFHTRIQRVEGGWTISRGCVLPLPILSFRCYSIQQQAHFLFSLSVRRSLHVIFLANNTSLLTSNLKWQHHFRMAAILIHTEPVGIGKQMHFHH